MVIPEGDAVPYTRDEILTLDEEATEGRRSQPSFSNGCTTAAWMASFSMKRVHTWHLIVKASVKENGDEELVDHYQLPSTYLPSSERGLWNVEI
jgi:hypothetical protein